MAKEVKTNAMRMLDKAKISYEINLYKCENFVDGVSIADALGQPYDSSFKTLVTVGKSGGHYVFVLPIAEDLDLKKAAKSVGEKSISMIPVKEITPLTGYISGGCTCIGMKKQFPTVIHSSAQSFDKIIVSGGKIGAQIFIAPSDLAKAANAKFDDIIM